jgi:hypothetical protein
MALGNQIAAKIVPFFQFGTPESQVGRSLAGLLMNAAAWFRDFLSNVTIVVARFHDFRGRVSAAQPVASAELWLGNVSL